MARVSNFGTRHPWSVRLILALQRRKYGARRACARCLPERGLNRLRKEKPMLTPIRTGAAFAVTAGVGYTLCTLAFWLFPEVAANFIDGLFHGLEFRKLQSGTTLFEFNRFFYVLMILEVWAFWLGALFGWVYEWLGRERLAVRA